MRPEYDAFWADLARDLRDPAYREEYERVSKQIARTDARRNAEADQYRGVPDGTPGLRLDVDGHVIVDSLVPDTPEEIFNEHRDH
jgi:hypothetical protein